MDNPTRLTMLADLQAYISRELGSVYGETRDAFIQDEISSALMNSDKFCIVLRTLADMLERRTPKRFDDQEARLLDQLERSFKLVEPKIIPFNPKEPA